MPSECFSATQRNQRFGDHQVQKADYRIVAQSLPALLHQIEQPTVPNATVSATSMMD
jgi:hypothetical protein